MVSGVQEVEIRPRRRIREVWQQNSVPVVLRRTGKGERLRVRLPPGNNKRLWLQKLGRTGPEWNSGKECWEIPKAWFNDFVNAALLTYNEVYIIQPYREQETCSPSCRNAIGHECACSCMGVHHGHGDDGTWYDVSDAFSVRWGERELACRLLTRRL